MARKPPKRHEPVATQSRHGGIVLFEKCPGSEETAFPDPQRKVPDKMSDGGIWKKVR